MPYRLTLYGELPGSKASVCGVIKELGEDCVLEYFWMDEEPTFDGYDGPLLQAPDGTYELWQETALVNILIAKGKIMVEGRLIRERPHSMSADQLDEKTLSAFQALLLRSEKLIHVYEEPGTGTRQYQFLFPGAEVPAEHPVAKHCRYIGVANLETGRICKTPETEATS